MRNEPVTRTVPSPLIAASIASPTVPYTASTLAWRETASAVSPAGRALGESGSVTIILEAIGAISRASPSASLSDSTPKTTVALPYISATSERRHAAPSTVCVTSRTRRVPSSLCILQGQETFLSPSRTCGAILSPKPLSSERPSTARAAFLAWCLPGRPTRYAHPRYSISTESSPFERMRTSAASSLDRGHPTARARPSRTSQTSSEFIVTQGTPRFMMPAFSAAISLMVEPRNAMCSMPMLLMIETSGEMTLVESSLPPMPTSTTATSADSSLKWSSAAAVSTSKLVHGRPSEAMASASALTRPSSRSRPSSDTSEPPTRMHSLTSRISGDVNAPALSPDSRRTDSIIAHIEPFPSVPATWTKRTPSCGLPRRVRSSSSLSRPSLIPLLAREENHRRLGPGCMISPRSICVPLKSVTPCPGMRCAFVSNSFLRGGKFSEPGAMFRAAAGRAGIEFAEISNSDLAVPLGDRRAVERATGGADFVLFWDKDVRCAANLELCGLPVLNGSECIRLCDDKSLTHLALAAAGVPSIDTVACPLTFSEYGDLGFADRAAEALGFPMVVKDCFGSFGEQVRLARDAGELRSVLSEPYRPRILQRYVECGGADVRVEVVGGRAVAAMARRAPEGDFRSNATIGGTVSGCEPTGEESELAVRACEAVGADFAGVDVIETGDGPVVCEVNSSAHLRNLLECTGIDASDAILAHAVRRVRG